MSNNQPRDGNKPNDRRNVEKPSTGRSDALENTSAESFYSARSDSTSFYSLASVQSIKSRPSTSMDASRRHSQQERMERASKQERKPETLIENEETKLVKPAENEERNPETLVENEERKLVKPEQNEEQKPETLVEKEERKPAENEERKPETLVENEESKLVKPAEIEERKPETLVENEESNLVKPEENEERKPETLAENEEQKPEDPAMLNAEKLNVKLKESDSDVSDEADSYLTEAEEYDKDEIDKQNKIKRPKKHRDLNAPEESSSSELAKPAVIENIPSENLSTESFLYESMAKDTPISQIEKPVHVTSSLTSSANEDKSKANAEDKVEVKFEDQVEDKVEVKFEDKVEVKFEDKVEVKFEDKVEDKPEVKFEDKAEVRGSDSDENYYQYREKAEHKAEEKYKKGSDLEHDKSIRSRNINDDQDFNIHDLRGVGPHRARGNSFDSRMSRMTTNLVLGNAFIYMVMPPDGGYGWFIVLISFLCQVVVDGIIFSVGIVMPLMAEDLGVSARSIALVASIQIGPITTAFINKYGFRPVALTGAILSITALLIASCSPNLVFMIIFYSIIGGPSLSMIWISSQLIIGYYFERYRPIANGVSCSGAGAGILLFSALNSSIAHLIGWRNTSRLHVLFLILVFFMAWSYIEVKPTRVAQLFEEESSSDESEHYQMGHIRYSTSRSVQQSTRLTDRGIDLMIEDYDQVEETPGFFRRWFQVCCPALATRSARRFPTDMEKRYVIRNDLLEKQDLFDTGGADYTINEQESGTDIIEGRQIEVLGENAQSVNYRINTMQADRFSATSRMTFKELRTTHRHPFLAYISPTNWLHPKVVRAFKMLFDLNMLKIMEFQILLLSAFLFPMGFNIPFVYSKIRAEIDSVNASLISPIIGFSNFLFRILSGFAAFKYRNYTTYICGGGIAFGGLFVFISAFYGENMVWFQFLYGFCYGVAPAFFSTLRAIIYVRTLGLDKLTNAFGLTAMAMGLGVFIGTTLAAIMNDATGSYSASFAFSGICLMVAALLKLLLPSIVRWKEKRKMKLRKIKVAPTKLISR